MDDALTRRRLVQVGATGTALTIAGCQFQQDDDGNGDDDAGNGVDSEIEGDARVAFSPPIDQQELMMIQQQAMQEAQEEGLSEEEAQEEAMEAVESAIDGHLDDLESDLGESGDLVVQDTSAQLGLVLADGDAEGILAALELDSVAAILPEESFEEPEEPPQP
ncbi:hypothetical protein [Halovivax gelatinilyticus]|uniref:hypothetical protein n=1 Tax=Halovivax gelatinilyticus TaxID=2961597 RepID=UPI0020CA2725|nr:hypothetical protein [Halovivax gelatinilyticus]